jgi:hypothetical protein
MNISVFVEVANAEENKRLEWINIILLFIEILHLFIKGFFEKMACFLYQSTVWKILNSPYCLRRAT